MSSVDSRQSRALSFSLSSLPQRQCGIIGTLQSLQSGLGHTYGMAIESGSTGKHEPIGFASASRSSDLSSASRRCSRSRRSFTRCPFVIEA
jgi:hypothetical protein